MCDAFAYEFGLDPPPNRQPRCAADLGLDDAGVASLGRGNALTFDNMLEGDVATGVRVAALGMERRGELRVAGVGRNAVVRPEIRGDHMAWLDPSCLPAGLAPVLDVFADMMLALNESAYLGARTLQCQLAIYRHGHEYTRHLDAPTPASSRRVTVIYYANAWQSGDGGELEVWENGHSRLVAPIADRLVVFLSQCTEHAVRPVVGPPRVAMSAFMHNE